jgi:hypothetical protein
LKEKILRRVTPLKTPFGLLVGFIAIFNHLTTITHNYLSRSVTFTQLTILHIHNYNHLFHSYTFNWLTSQLAITISNYHTFCIFTLPVSVSYRDLTRRTAAYYSLVELTSKDWLLRHFSSSYNPQSYKCHCSSEQGESCVVSGHCVYMALPRKRACCRVTSSQPVAQEPYSNSVAWRHRGCAEKTPPPLLPRSAYSVARRLAVGYPSNALLCNPTMGWHVTIFYFNGVCCIWWGIDFSTGCKETLKIL